MRILFSYFSVAVKRAGGDRCCCGQMPVSRQALAAAIVLPAAIAIAIYIRTREEEEIAEAEEDSENEAGNGNRQVDQPADLEKEHVRVRAAALEAMVAASITQSPVPALRTDIAPTQGWLRCVEALAGVEKMLQDFPASPDADSTDQVIISACDVAKLTASGPKRTVDELLARHAKRVFPQLPATLTGNPSQIILLLDAPNTLTTKALADTFPELYSAGFAARICIPQCDPDHYAKMVTQVWH